MALHRLQHVGSKCRHCPESVRERLLEMQKNCTGGNYGRDLKASLNFTSSSSNKESINHAGCNRPKYGSRKVFFERLWGRLHNKDIPKIPRDTFPGYGDHKGKQEILEFDYSDVKSQSLPSYSKEIKTKKLNANIFPEKKRITKQQNEDKKEKYEMLKLNQESPGERRGKRKRKAPTFYS